MTLVDPMCFKCSKAIIVFIAWTVSSFLCHQCGKLFMDSIVHDVNMEHRGLFQFVAALILTLIQCLACLVSFKLKPGNETKYSSILLGAHALATLAVNYSLAYTEAASTLAIKLTEPVFMCLADVLIFKTKPSFHSVIALPAIITGSLIFCGVTADSNAALTGIVLAFLSNIILAVRNVTLKKLQVTDASTSTLESRQSTAQYACGILQFSVIVITSLLDTSMKVTCVCGLLFLSGFFHVMYSYISTTIVLKAMDVVSHSIANIFKRLLVVVMLYGLGKRQATPWNFVGLCIAVVGLLIYAYDKLQKKIQIRSPVTIKKISCKTILRLIVTVACLASMSFVFQDIRVDVVKSPMNGGVNDLQSEKINPEFEKFLNLSLVDHPLDTNKLAENLTNAQDIIQENQRILLNLLGNIIGKAQNVMLMDIPAHNNKGDSAIVVGEVMIIKKLKKRIVYYCETYKCFNLKQAVDVSQKYPVDDLVILLHGGGNLVGYDIFDKERNIILNTFPNHKTILLSQSIFLHDNYTRHLAFCRKVYSNRTNLTIFLRDKQSLAIAKENFKGVNMYLAPDLAFCIGYVPRMLPPHFDIIWLRRKDVESTKYEIPPKPTGVTVHVSDWTREWPSSSGTTDLENSFIIAQDGFTFLQRGRVVITDRLHGHILSVLMDIPHVLIDNPPFYKLSSFDQTWTANLENKLMASNGTDALELALLLLAKYNHTLPEIGPKDMYVNKINLAAIRKN